MSGFEEIKPVPDKNSARWYIVTTYGSHENKVAENIIARIESFGLQDYVFDAFSAEETVIVEDKNGKKKEKKQNLYKGYVFVQMIMTDDSWYMVRNTPGVTGICGSSGGGTKPAPVPNDEIAIVRKRAGKIDTQVEEKYKVGDRVRIINDAFQGKEGTIKTINADERVAGVEIFLLGFQTINISFDDLELIK